MSARKWWQSLEGTGTRNKIKWHRFIEKLNRWLLTLMYPTNNMMFTTDSRRSYSSVDGVAKSQEGAAVSLHPRRRARSEGGVSLQDALSLIGGRVENLGGDDGEHHQEEESHLRTKVAFVTSRLPKVFQFLLF
jgi:hypothetical protein